MPVNLRSTLPTLRPGTVRAYQPGQDAAARAGVGRQRRCTRGLRHRGVLRPHPGNDPEQQSAGPSGVHLQRVGDVPDHAVDHVDHLPRRGKSALDSGSAPQPPSPGLCITPSNVQTLSQTQWEPAQGVTNVTLTITEPEGQSQGSTVPPTRLGGSPGGEHFHRRGVERCTQAVVAGCSFAQCRNRHVRQPTLLRRFLLRQQRDVDPPVGTCQNMSLPIENTPDTLSFCIRESNGGRPRRRISSRPTTALKVTTARHSSVTTASTPASPASRRCISRTPGPSIPSTSRTFK